MQAPSPATPWYKDWTQYICPGPTRRFSPEEMARAGQQPWPAGIDRFVFGNVATLLAVNYALIPKGLMVLLVPVGLILTALALAGAHRLWREPGRVQLNLLSFGAVALVLLLTFGLRNWRGADKTTLVLLGALLSLLLLTVTAWWFLVIHRHAQIEARLRDLEAQDAHDRLTRRLATAQIHPHFVFNTLASLTHWVETGDARAAPLLRDFNAYLRATLPMFEREQQPLAAELELVRRYLAIMQARLGERLGWQLQADPALDALPLPPGSLLTLVENAVTHGIEPSLRGGRIELRAERDGATACLTVRNSGADFDPTAPEGLGLSNTRQRLLALHPQAQLQLRALDAGCEARLTCPLPA